MNKYWITYRNKDVKEIQCYSDEDAKDKARTWFRRQCTEKNKTIVEVRIRRPNGSVTGIGK